jgi:hypothetical protein
MEAMLRISLYNYPYFTLAITLCFPYYCLCFLFNKIGEEGRTGSAGKQRAQGRRGRGTGAGGTDGPNNVCTYE